MPKGRNDKESFFASWRENRILWGGGLIYNEASEYEKSRRFPESRSFIYYFSNLVEQIVHVEGFGKNGQVAEPFFRKQIGVPRYQYD